jgi:hypothetical protein
MSSLIVDTHPRAREVSIGEDELTVLLADGRKISVPVTWFPRPMHAPPDARQRFELIGDGEGIHWPGIGEDLSIAGLLLGTPALRNQP